MADERRIARIPVTLELVRQMFHMPDDMQLHAIEGSFPDAFVSGICYFVVESPALSPVSEAEAAPTVDVEIRKEGDGRCTWQFTP